jgi:hypothetical protein
MWYWLGSIWRRGSCRRLRPRGQVIITQPERRGRYDLCSQTASALIIIASFESSFRFEGDKSFVDPSLVLPSLIVPAIRGVSAGLIPGVSHHTGENLLNCKEET